MSTLLGFVVIAIVYGIVSTMKGGGGPYDRLVRRGIPARGILLQVAPRGVRAGTRQRPFERRQVVIDVEVPGEAPFEVTASPIIPLNLVRDVLPGATVELRLDRTNRTNMAIIGPGVGFVQSAVRTAS